MIGPWTSDAKNDIFALLLATDKAMFDTRGLVDTFEAVPIAFRNIGQFGLEAISVIAFVTAITE